MFVSYLSTPFNILILDWSLLALCITLSLTAPPTIYIFSIHVFLYKEYISVLSLTNWTLPPVLFATFWADKLSAKEYPFANIKIFDLTKLAVSAEVATLVRPASVITLVASTALDGITEATIINPHRAIIFFLFFIKSLLINLNLLTISINHIINPNNYIFYLNICQYSLKTFYYRFLLVVNIYVTLTRYFFKIFANLWKIING